MNNFQLILDTTPPNVELYAPQYVLNGHYLEFKVTASELVDINRYQAKVSDNGLKEYSLNLFWDNENKEFTGLIDTYNFINGIAKIEVTLFDEVHNSSKAEKIFTVLKNDLHDIELSIKLMLNRLSIIENHNNLKLDYMNNVILNNELRILVNLKTQNNSIRIKAGDNND